MSYKVCTRCQFLVSEKRKICNTCGGKKFYPIAAGAGKESRTEARSEQPTAHAPNAAARTPAHVRAVVASARPVRAHAEHRGVQADTERCINVAPAQLAADGTPVVACRSLREKFNMEEERLRTMRWEETWTKLRNAFLR